MKPFAILLMILCLAALVGVGYLYMSTDLAVAATGCVATDALDQPEYFQSLISSVANSTFTGTLFGATGAEEAASAQYYTYTLRLRNNTFLPARAVELQITPIEGDLLQLGELARHDLPARSTGDFQATLLTRKDLHNVREITVTWYFWGLPFSLRTTYRHAS